MRLAVFAIFILLHPVLLAQRIQTIVPSQPVVIGTAFQVQYIIIEPTAFNGAQTPLFENFTLVSGPNHYRGKAIIDGRMQVIENITYTLVPQKTGTLTVPAIHASFRDRNTIQSENVAINVIPKPKMSFLARSSYTDAALYAPSSQNDLDRMINENIFIRAEVNKKTCYVGEAIIASFKLYSRLQSSSELVRVPSLYGFSVIDVLDIKESHQAVETINGKVFNTSILRKVQIYPEQSGALYIDEMVVKNEIEFDDSLDNDKKTVVEKELRSKPILIHVKPLPLKKPSSYNGAVGDFSVSSVIDKKVTRVNEQVKFKLIISGKGNFIQFGEPVINWPEGLDVFDPIIEDELNTASVPSQGKRTYTYGIVSDSAGGFIIPPVSISYFDPSGDSFKKISTPALELNITPVENNNTREIITDMDGGNSGIWWIVSASLITIALVTFLIRTKKRTEKPVIVLQEPVLSISSRIEAMDLDQLSEKLSCIEITRHLNDLQKMHTSISGNQLHELESIKKECQLMAYSNVKMEGARQLLKQRAVELARQVEQ